MKTAMANGAVFLVLIGAFAWTAWGDRLRPAAVPRGANVCEHGVEKAACEICNPKLARGGTVATRVREPKPGECPNTLVKIELGPGAAERAGLVVVPVEARPVAETARGNAETEYVPAAWARVAPRLGGVVREVAAGLGQAVEAGATLAIVESPELAEAKSAWLIACAERDLRQELHAKAKDLLDKHVATGKDELEARTQFAEASLAVQSAELKLRALGLAADQVAALAKDKDPSPRLAVVAPFAGTVVAASAVAGESASPDRPLFEIAALDRMWVVVDLAEGDLSRVQPGQRAVFLLEALPGKKFAGKVSAIGTSVDEQTRTLKVYAEVKNPEGLLRAHMFGRAEITVKTAAPVLMVPREAVQSDGDCALVFVESTKDVFQARKLELGTAFEGGFEVKGGLLAGERVATTGSFLLKAEAMKGQMGAG